MEQQEYKTPKALMAAVIGMGVLIVLGTAGLVGVILHRMNAPHAPTTATVPLVDTPRMEPSRAEVPPAAAHLSLGTGERVLSTTRVRDNVLALHIGGPRGDRLVLWDATSGQVWTGLDAPAAP
ncbi:hypothetical protein K2X14_07930 [Acetobacter sp. TBRC 12305]|uniref:Uncharacterized protein n=1 Tax=Acetobacter garciniae TaxID=2817435 RepID=A0A939HPC5_9PROT|nr:hypothetical protein [Acetobacter garciniae]MBO1325267.1 hypothetical protein [Acetobacter garciniae]MBX0344761.1 hypothetical protein [Acetobacter garciniae]